MAASGTGDDGRDGGALRQAPEPRPLDGGAVPVQSRPDDDILAFRPQKRASPLRVLALLGVSILVTAVLFRAVVEVLRAVLDP
ncbi:hypothetical protein [Roseomonas fluvialis]|uniref:Uncharacterized protein n=1 Tax=Roseomonas fluvialis TaxID=1750527 RepID=A0ABN6P194_9PROT|nr:hypothetical protein [Roseomonas fluvialis]BDG71404.1 hypothetical protein Rmf_13330 [Roseomonas fluvialis]